MFFEKKAVSGILLTLLLASVFVSASSLQPVKAFSGTIVIRADGSIVPPTAPMSTVDNVTYVLTVNFTGDADGIVVERNNIAIDGGGYMILGQGSGNGIFLSERTNVTVRNTDIENFQDGIYLSGSNDNIISGNYVILNEEGIQLVSSSNNTVSGNIAEISSYGIVLGDSSNNNFVSGNDVEFGSSGGIVLGDSSNNNNVSGNDVEANGSGIVLGDSSNNNTVSGNKVTGNSCGIYLRSISNNSVSGNTVTANGIGICLGDSSNNDIVCGNSVSANGYGIYVNGSSNNNMIFHNNLIDNPWYLADVNCGNTWDDGYPSGGNYWSDYNGTDLLNGPYQNLTGSDGIVDVPYVIDANNTDGYPLTKPYAGPHDVGFAEYVSKTVIFENTIPSINMTIINYGEQEESFNFTFDLVTTNLEQPITLDARNSTTITVMWNTSGLAMCARYFLSASVGQVAGETDTTDNVCSRTIYISMAGDLTGVTPFVPDGKVDGKDIAKVALCFGSAPGCPPPYVWNPNSDVNNDAKVDGKDIALVALHFGEAQPEGVFISANSTSIKLGDSVLFTHSTPTNVGPPYGPWWYLNHTLVPDAGDNWIFTPTVEGSYIVQLVIRGEGGDGAVSNIITLTVS